MTKGGTRRFNYEYEEAYEQGWQDAEHGEGRNGDDWQNGCDDAWRDGSEDGGHGSFFDDNDSDGLGYGDDDRYN